MNNLQLVLPSCYLTFHPSSPWTQAQYPICKSSQWNTCLQCNLPLWGHIISLFFNLLKESLPILNLQMSGLQILAFVSGLAGLGATIGATVSNEWRATSRASSVITATWVLQGLWNNCAGNAIGALHCRPHHTILQLEGKLHRGQGFMATHTQRRVSVLALSSTLTDRSERNIVSEHLICICCGIVCNWGASLKVLNI